VADVAGHIGVEETLSSECPQGSTSLGQVPRACSSGRSNGGKRLVTFQPGACREYRKQLALTRR